MCVSVTQCVCLCVWVSVCVCGGEGLDRGESEGGDKGMCQLVEGKRKKG